MEKFIELRERAKKNIQVADHMITMSYPMFKDPKILVSAVNNLLISADCSVSSILEYERLFKRIPVFHESLDVKLKIFKDKIVPSYSLSKDRVSLVKNLMDLSSAHKNSSVEFPRNEKFVMCSDSYELRTLSLDDLKKLISEAKLLVDDAYRVTSKNDRIFK